MKQTDKQWRFNFGPIARTVAGDNPRDKNNAFNLSSLSVHVMLDALMVATSRDEFVAWLWHDLFKPVFYWVPPSPGAYNWIHIPGLPPFVDAEGKYASITNIATGLVRSHQGIPKSLSPTYDLKSGEQQLSFKEGPIIEDQFDQVGLGNARHILSSWSSSLNLPCRVR